VNSASARLGMLHEWMCFDTIFIPEINVVLQLGKNISGPFQKFVRLSKMCILNGKASCDPNSTEQVIHVRVCVYRTIPGQFPDKSRTIPGISVATKSKYLSILMCSVIVQ
jgi:hypothetical protein